MFLFDWTKIYNASHGNVREVVRIFRMLVTSKFLKIVEILFINIRRKTFLG